MKSLIPKNQNKVILKDKKEILSIKNQDLSKVKIFSCENENAGKLHYLPQWFDTSNNSVLTVGEEAIVITATDNKSRAIEAIISGLSLVPKQATEIQVVAHCDVSLKHLVAELIIETSEKFDMKSTQKEIKPKTLIVAAESQDLTALKKGEAYALVKSFINNLIYAPSNIVTPQFFAEQVTSFIQEYKLEDKITLNIHQEKDLEKLKMGALLAVAKASTNPPVMIELEYMPKQRKQIDVCFVGKGVTFDSGGLSIKPGTSMSPMKADMSGAATTVGLILYAALVDLNINLVTIAALCENMIAGNSLKPSDVITTMSGKTVEVDNTDAEGRLILADALFYSQKFQATNTIDVATLTGACVMALSVYHSGLFSDDTELVKKLKLIGDLNGDKVWQLPLDRDHMEMVKSKIADLNNISTVRGGGAIVGAAFLKHFAPSMGWAHIDVAGTAHINGTPTGRPFKLLSDYLDVIEK